jgi:primary-amine oxidase
MGQVSNAAGHSYEGSSPAKVLWYVFVLPHITWREDWPVMPADIVSFWLKPCGFSGRNPPHGRNPSHDVPPSHHH